MTGLKRMLLPVIALFTLWASTTAKKARYTNQWVAEIRGGEQVAQRVARDLGYTYKGQIALFDDHYLLARSDHAEFFPRDSSHLTRALEDLNEVKWAEQQLAVERSKRGLLPEYHERSPESDYWDTLMGTASKYSSTTSYRPTITDEPADPNEVGKGDFDTIPDKTFSTKPAEGSQLETYEGVTLHGKSFSRQSSVYEGVYNDPMWDLQWYLQDYRIKNMPVMDHNVVPVHKMGYTGKDVTVMVVDDGIDEEHRDLVGNFDKDLSYDFCADRPGCKPDVGIVTGTEGTMCAGIIAMVANNRKCGVGIAYKAKVAGAKILCSGRPGSSLRESQGLVHALEKVDIYSNSWGPPDDGKTMEKISKVNAGAIDRGVSKGRNGKGAIYVFSAGNGKHVQDNCAADGLANYIHTIVIASASQLGKAAYYSEACSAVFATAYSGDATTEAVVSTIPNRACTKSFTGTAPSVPIASAIIALALDAKPDLSYRDVMHLIAWSSEVAPLANNEDTWNKNGRGLWVSKDFGFGLLNAENMVNLAKNNWKHVPKMVTCTETIKVVPSQFYAVEGLKLFHDAKACQDHGDDGVRYLEHIELTTTVEYGNRGAITIYVKSPEGTKTTLLSPRPKDTDPNGLQSWTIKSVHNWGENPKGRWIIGVRIADNSVDSSRVASAQDFTITFHGTHSKPNHYNHPRTYAAFRLPDGRTSHVPS